MSICRKKTRIGSSVGDIMFPTVKLVFCWCKLCVVYFPVNTDNIAVLLKFFTAH